MQFNRWYFVVLLLPGCAGRVTAPAIAPADIFPVGLESADSRHLFEAVLDTLRDHNFDIARVDRRAGVITTGPVSSQHFFEFWRNDVRTRRDAWEATLNPIRRSVRVELARRGEAWESLDVVVSKERFTSPDRQFNSTGATYKIFGSDLPSTTGLERISEAHDRWVEIGRDPAMESHVLQQILERAGRRIRDQADEG